MPSMLSDATRAALVADLRAQLGDRCTTNPTQIEHHSHGESWHAPSAPDVVVFPLTTDEVAACVRAAARHGAPVVAFGVGSSLEGHVNAVRGGVSVDFSRMNRVLRVSAENLDSGEKVLYEVLGPWDGGPEDGVLNYRSPLGQFFLGEEIDDEFDAKLPGGTIRYKILEIASTFD